MALRHRLRDDAELRRRFPTELWPTVVTMVAENPDIGLLDLVTAPKIWDLLMMRHGPLLVERFGPGAAEFLFGPQSHGYSARFKERIAETLVAGDNATVEALRHLKDNSGFQELFMRPLSGADMARLLNDLYQQCGGQTFPCSAVYARLDDLKDLSNADLIKPA